MRHIFVNYQRDLTKPYRHTQLAKKRHFLHYIYALTRNREKAIYDELFTAVQFKLRAFHIAY